MCWVEEGWRDALSATKERLPEVRVGEKKKDRALDYVSLDEIQPFLLEALDLVQGGCGSQLFVVSHHPEYLNQLAPSDGHVVFRERGGPTRVRRFAESAAIPPAEIVARGGLQREGEE